MVFLLSMVFAFQLDPSVKQQVVDAIKGMSHFKVRFVQETYSDFFDETHAQGELFISRPGRFRMAYTEGERKTFICDGKTCYEEDRFAGSRSFYRQAEIREEPLVRLLLYGSDLERLFILDRYKNERDVTVFRLTPREEKDAYHLELVFDENWLPLSMEVIEAEGNGTRFHFSNYDMSGGFPPNTFTVPEREPDEGR